MKAVAKIICPTCGLQISKSNASKHARRHQNHPETFDIPKYRVNHDGLVCQFCNKIWKNRNSLCNHERQCIENPNKQCIDRSNIKGFNAKGNIPWNKGLTADTDQRIAKSVKTRKKFYAEHPEMFAGRKHTEETKQKISEAQLAVDHDANVRYSYGKRGYLDNMFFMSTWELIYYIYMRDHGHKIIRCPYRYLYEYESKKHKYAPDFLVDDTLIVEIKGRETDLDRVKYQAVPNLLIIRKDEISEYNKYIKECYHTDLPETLYDIFLDKEIN